MQPFFIYSANHYDQKCNYRKIGKYTHIPFLLKGNNFV